MEETPETIQVTIKNKFTNRSKDLIVYVSDDVNLYQHIYDNPSVHGAFVRTWSSNIVSAVKDGRSTIVCSVENTPIVLSLTQMKNTTTKQLYHHVAKAGSLSNINLTLDVVKSDSLADEMTVQSDAITDDGLGSTHRFPIVEENPSDSILSNAIQTMNIKIQNQFTMRSTVLDIRISEDVTIFDEIYDNPALLQAQIRNWSSDIVAGIKNESKVIVGSVSGTQVKISISKMKETSTKQLHGYVLQAAPRQHPQLVLGIIKSDEVPYVDARFELQQVKRSEKDNKLEDIPTKKDELDDSMETVASDLDNSINFDKEEMSRMTESKARATKGKDEETVQGSTDIETDSSIHEDDDTVIAGNESPTSLPRSQHQTSPNCQIPSIIMSSRDEMESAKDENTALVASLDFDQPHIERKTVYDEYFLGDEAGFEITIDKSAEDEFKVSIAEEELELTEDYPNPNIRDQHEKEAENNESFHESNSLPAAIKKISAANEVTDVIENQIEIEASFIPRSHLQQDFVSLAQTVEVFVHCQAETAQIAPTKIQSLASRSASRSAQSSRRVQATIIQAAFRGSKARTLYKRDMCFIVKVQAFGRRWLVKQMLLKRELAALKIQSVLRLKERQKVAKFTADKGKRSKAEGEAIIGAEEEARLTAQARAPPDEEASIDATLTRLKAKQDARLKAEAEARLQAEEEARLVADAQAKAEKAIAALEAEEEARLKTGGEVRLMSLDAPATTADDAEGVEVEYISLSQEEQYDEVHEVVYAEAIGETSESTSGLETALEESASVKGEVNGIDLDDEVVVQLLPSDTESPEAQKGTEARQTHDVVEYQGDDASKVESEVATRETIARISEEDSDSKFSRSEVAMRETITEISEEDSDSKKSRLADVSTGSESGKQQNDSVVESTLHSCETFGIHNTRPMVEQPKAEGATPTEPKAPGPHDAQGVAEDGKSNRNDTTKSIGAVEQTKAEGATPTEPKALLPHDAQGVAEDEKSNRNGTTKSIGAALITMVTMAGISVKKIGSEGTNVTTEENDRNKKSEMKVGVSVSPQDPDTDNDSTSLDTIDLLIMGLEKKRDRLVGSSDATSSNTNNDENGKVEEKREYKSAVLPSSQESHTETNSTSLDTLDRMVLEVDSNSYTASSSRSSEKRDLSAVVDEKTKISASQDSVLNREQASSTPTGFEDVNVESSGSKKALRAVPLPSIVTTTNKDNLQTSQPASVCSSLNTSPSYYEKFESKIGSKMVLKALHTPVSEAKKSHDGMILIDDDHSSKLEVVARTSGTESSKDDIITLTARYEEFAKQLKSLVIQANVFHQAISEKEKARTKFFEECASMTNGTPLYLDVGKNAIPESANVSYARAQIKDLKTPRSMFSVVALAQIYSSNSVTECQQQILAYVTAWTEAVTSKVEAELQTYDKLEEILYHYEVKVDELRAKSKGNTSTKLTRNYKKLAVAGQKRDEQLDRVCYLLKAVVDNSWKDLYPLIEQTMVWETNRRDGQVDTVGMMLPKTMALMKENIKSGKTIPAPDQESLEAELNTQTRENRKLQYRINKLDAILRSNEWSNKNEMIPNISSFKFRPVGPKTAE